MDRKKDAAERRLCRLPATQLLTMIIMVGLGGLVTVSCGCKSPGGQRSFYQQVRPASDTARLVKNAAYLRQTGRMELAVKELEEAHQLEPGNLAILDALIQCYENLGHFERALELYDEARVRAGAHPALENNRCYSLFLAGRLDKAAACFREILARQPDNQNARNNLGLVLCRQGREAEALALWREALGPEVAQQRLGQALATLGREVPPSLASQSQPVREHQVATPSQPAPPLAASSPKPLASVPQAQDSPPSGTPAAAAPKPADSPIQAVVPPKPPRPATVPEVASTPSGEVTTARGASRLALKPEAVPSPAPIQAPAPVVEAVPSTAAPTPAPIAETIVAARPPQEKPAAPATVMPARESHATPIARLNANDLGNTRLEIRNGNGKKNIARDTRSLLSGEGFNVVGIGNHIDFGIERTVIAYRPGSARVAKVLSQKFFPGAKLKEGGKVSAEADIRVSLGLDWLTNYPIAFQSSQTKSVAASTSPPPVSSAPAVSPEKTSAPVTEKASPKVASRPPAPSPVKLPYHLAASELSAAGIEIKNGNGVQNQARKLRSRLDLEGFNVVSIGNHIDFGLEETVIAYRPEAARVAEVLAQKFFPGAKLQEGGKLSAEAAIRVSLGRDLLAGQQQLVQVIP